MGRFRNLGISPAKYEPVTLNFGEWLPDLQALNNPGGVEASGVIPKNRGYVPFKDIAPIPGLALPSACTGALVLEDRYQNARLYAATRTNLYVRTGGAFTSLYTNGVATSDGSQWQFVPFGKYLVALHLEVSPQYTDTDGAGAFIPVGGSPPKALCGARVRDFMVLGNLDDEPLPDTARQPSRIRWGGFNRIDAPWTTDPSTEADFNDMPSEGGAVMAITGREFGSVFQEKLISRMTYKGLPEVFDIETVEEAPGAICTSGVVQIGAVDFYISDDGFYRWDGTNSVPVGTGKVADWFFSRLNFAERKRIVASVDYANKCVLWLFPTVGTALDTIILYSYAEDRWAHVDAAYEYLLPAAVLPASLDDMLLNLDTDYLISFDDNSYKTGRSRLAGFSSGHAYGLMVGAALAARLETGDYNSPDSFRVAVKSARPLVDTSAATVSLARRDQLQGEAVVYDTAVAQELTGEVPVLGEARYMRFRVDIPAGATWTHAQGVEVWRKAMGRR